jgi:hypothetical protein
VGEVYRYQGRNNDLNGKSVKVLALHWDGSNLPEDEHLVHVVALGRGGKATETTFGCDPRWLSRNGELSPNAEYHNLLAKGNKNIRPVKSDPDPFGLRDAEEETSQSFLWEV